MRNKFIQLTNMGFCVVVTKVIPYTVKAVSLTFYAFFRSINININSNAKLPPINKTMKENIVIVDWYAPSIKFRRRNSKFLKSCYLLFCKFVLRHNREFF